MPAFFKELDVVAELVAFKVERQAVDLAVGVADAFLCEFGHVGDPGLIAQILKLALPELGIRCSPDC